ncbi:MAG: glycoside hydrolase family 31 protein, partial [Budvicia sp.]|nr:glycoside hydrolase family 31 protein [Budvicia sp.]
PDAELFVRWVQNGVMHPRFTIHSWNDDHTANEPWMYPEVTPAIRNAINLRYRLIPYFYNLLWQAHRDDEPMIRPTFLDHEHDVNTFSETDDFLIGRDLLVASVVEEGQRERSVYLPANQTGWYCFYTGEWFTGGQTIMVPAPLERLPLLVRAGSVLPASRCLCSTQLAKEQVRELYLFPQQGSGSSSGDIFEDDGESFDYLTQNALWLDWTLTSDSQRIDLTIQTKGRYVPSWDKLVTILPQTETRPLFINGEQVSEVVLASLC